MKKIFKNILFIVLFVMVSILGATNVNAASKDIEVTDIKVKEKTGTIIVEEPTITDGNISSGIKFNEVGDFVTYELTLKNNESDKYKVISMTDNNENENIDIEYTYGEDFIGKGETSKVTVKLTYKNKLINKNISLDDLEIKLNLEKEDGTSSRITLNPKTGDNILEYVLLFIASGLGLFFVITKKKIKGFKVGNLLLILAVILIPFAVLANEKYELSIKFTDIEVKGEFEVYNITINPNNDTSIIIKDITYGQPIGELPENPEKEGYEFVKWVDEDGNEITEETVITKQIEIEAVFNAIDYNITYDLDGGSLPSGKTNPIKYTIESDDITLNNPEKQGYTFSGWSGTGIVGQTTSLTISHGSTEDRIYEAHYSANEDTEYKVIHKFAKLNGDYEIEEVIEHGTTGSTVPAPRKTRTGFVTPTVQNVTIKADGSASVTYTYEREEYTFSITDRTYVDNISTANGTYKYGTEIIVKAVNRAGYDFAWSDGDTNLERTFTLESAKELTPIYTAKTNTKYVIKHYKQKVTLDGYDLVEQDIQNLEGITDSPIIPAVNNYYGFISPEVQNTTIKGDESTVVEYKYNRKLFNVTFDTDGGSTVSEQSIIYEEKASRPTTIPQKEHYTFDDWYTSDTYETKYDFNTMIITEDTVIYAKYNLVKYTVIFDSNGGSGSMANQGIYSGISTNLSLNTFTAPENMIFDSWNTKADGSGTSYTDGEKINLEKSDGETITLYAQWRPTAQTWSMTSDNVHVTDGYITLEVGDQITGYSVNVDNTTYGDGDWFVMGAQDGKLLITLKPGVGQKVAKGNALNWPSFVANLDNIASHYKNPTYADNSRSINLSDINRVTGFTPYEMESITFTNDNGIIRTKDIPDDVNVYSRDFYYYDFESSSWKKLSNGSSISFASNGYQYGPGPSQNNVNGSEKAYDLFFKDTHDKNYMIDGHVVTYRGNQYWLADAVIMTSSGQGMIYYCFQYIDYESVDWAIVFASDDNPADSSYSEYDNFVRPVVTLKSEVHINASGTIIN